MSYSQLHAMSSMKTAQNPSGARRGMLPAAAAVLALAMSFAVPSQAQEGASRQQGLSRAEVIADLALWRRSGADRYEELSRSYGLDTKAYEEAYQEYLRLRSSDAFQSEIQKATDKK